MNRLLSLFVLPLLLLTVYSCDKSDDENMVWEIISNSDQENIQVVNETTVKLDRPSNLWIQANGNSGDLVVRCINHPISISPIVPDESYTNQEMGFTLTVVDSNTLNIHFDEISEEAMESYDQIAVTNVDQKSVVCNTFIWISRVVAL